MYKNSYPGKFIVFEGLDKSGKTTQAKLILDYFLNQRKEVVLTREPTDSNEDGNEIGKLIKRVLTNQIKIKPATFQLLFAADRSEHLEKTIIPSLREGKIIISDRYFFSSFAYGSINLDLDWLIKINEQFMLPDLTILIDVRPEICMERLINSGAKREFFEKQEQLKKAKGTFLNLPEKFENFHIINGEQSIENVFKDIKGLVQKFKL